MAKVRNLDEESLMILKDFCDLSARVEHALFQDLYVKKKNINDLKRTYQIKFGINARHFNSIADKLKGKAKNWRENQLNKITALIGSGPAYFIHFAESIMKTFKSFGFTEAESMKYSLELFYTTAYSCIVDDRALGLIKKSIISKNGTTEAALKKMNQRNFQKNIKESILAAYKRSQELSGKE